LTTLPIKESTRMDCPLCGAGVVRKFAFSVFDHLTMEPKLLVVSEKLYEAIRLANKPKPTPTPEIPPLKRLEDVVKENGFENEQEFHRLVASLDLGKPGMLRKFRNWQENNPTKLALQALLES
jgi:hypothetical protein